MLVEKMRTRQVEHLLPFGRLYGEGEERGNERDRRARPFREMLRQQLDLIEKYQVVVAHLGVEYECPLGHRFFVTGKSKGPKNTRQQEHSSLLSHDLPIIMPCPCNSNASSASSSSASASAQSQGSSALASNSASSARTAPIYAQLMRIFVATPASEVVLTLNPIVKKIPSPSSTSPASADATPPVSAVSTPQVDEIEQAEDDGVVFTTGSPHGVLLPRDSLIVLRLPYVYVENGIRYHPLKTPMVLCRHYAYFVPPKTLPVNNA